MRLRLRLSLGGLVVPIHLLRFHGRGTDRIVVGRLEDLARSWIIVCEVGMFSSRVLMSRLLMVEFLVILYEFVLVDVGTRSHRVNGNTALSSIGVLLLLNRIGIT